MKPLKPKTLAKGDTIGILAPASGGSAEGAEQGIEWLKEQGFQVKLGKSVAGQYGFLSASDEVRADDLHQMFSDPHIDAILCLRGGYGSMRLLDRINFHVIGANPKIFIGYSDITALHLAILQRTGLITFHGPMAASDMGNNIPDYSKDALFQAILSGRAIGRILNPTSTPPPVCLSPGTAKGILTGGNLTLITATLGTPYEIDTRGKILFLEEVAEAPYRIDRMLTQLLLAGKLQSAAGIVLDVFAGCDEEAQTVTFRVEEVLRERLGSLTLPVLSGLYFGHTADKATLPLGVTATLDSTAGELVITESATK